MSALPRQLSLFDEPPPVPAIPSRRPTAPTPAPEATLPPRPPVAPAQPAPAAPCTPPLTLPDARTHREVRLDGRPVAYRLRRGRLRSIRFVIGADGLSVSAPRWVPQAEIDAALQQRAGWILRKLHERHEHERRVAAARIAWGDGAVVPYLGRTLTVVLDPRHVGVSLHAGPGDPPGHEPAWLRVGLPRDAAPAQVRDAVQSWLQRQARQLFEQRCAEIAPRLGVRVKRLSLSSATTRWGSARADGSIRLHWRLLHFGLPVIDYVVAHELAHLREMNHSPAFWDVVRSVLPDYEHPRGLLRRQVVPPPD